MIEINQKLQSMFDIKSKLTKITKSISLPMDKQQTNRMQQEILSGQNYDNNEEDFQILAQNSSSPEEIFFDQVVAALQQIIVDQKFQNIQTSFMKQYCHLFEDTEENKIEYMGIFKNYQNEIQKHIEKSLYQMVPGFQMETFLELLQTRTEQIDEQILEILHSFSDFEIFKRLILDYKSYYEEEERLKTLTIKSNKIPESKKVKGTNNIFSNNGGLHLEETKPLTSLKKSQKPTHKKHTNQKTEEELLIPDLVLTVRPLRKA